MFVVGIAIFYGYNQMIWWSLKALANEDTLLQTHCCSWCFLGCANWETFVADTKCFWSKSETFFVSWTQICACNKCCARGQTGKHLCRQQCIRNNVSSFARALSRASNNNNISVASISSLMPSPINSIMLVNVEKGFVNLSKVSSWKCNSELKYTEKHIFRCVVSMQIIPNAP